MSNKSSHLSNVNEDASERKYKRSARYADRVRHGKTLKDRKSDAAKRASTNRSYRAEWVNRTRPLATGGPEFPLWTCNGKNTQRLRKKTPAVPCPQGGATRSRATRRRYDV